jgi:hypothetical protein
VASPTGTATTGTDEFVGHFKKALADIFTVHHALMPDIEQTSPTTATGIWSMEGVNRWPDGRELHEFAETHDTYETVNGSWRVKSSRSASPRRCPESGQPEVQGSA